MHPILEPWAISEAGMQLVLAVWTRGEQFSDVLAKARADRGDKPLVNDTGSYRVEGGVAVIPIVGPLMRHADMFSEISGATSYAGIRKDLSAALADGDVHSILLKIDSPGGECNGCGELADQIRAAHAKKRVTAYVEGYGASGGYWLAAAAGRIICSPTAVLGSIGVRCAVTDDAGAQEKLGVKHIEIVSSQSPAKRGTPIDDGVIARVQAHADALCDVFIESVANFRGVTEKKVQRDFGGGAVFVGRDAVKAGLADEIGSFDSTLAALRGASRPSAAQGKNDMQTQTETELVPKAELEAAQAEIKALKAQAAKVEAAAPVLAVVAKLTKTENPTVQVGELLAMADKAASAPTAAQLQATERAQILAGLQAKNVSPDRIAALEAAADAAPTADVQLAVLRAGAAKLEAPRVYQPATQERNAAAPVQTEAEIAINDNDRAFYHARGITDEAQMLERKRAGIEAQQQKGRA